MRASNLLLACPLHKAARDLFPMPYRAALATLVLLANACGAQAEPTDIFKVRDALDSVGQKSSRLGILYGQPTISGKLQGFGTVVALNQCHYSDADLKSCEEVSFRACIRLRPEADRMEMLEAANDYNLESDAGTLVLDCSDRIGLVTCILMNVELRAENIFDSDEAFNWAQALRDFGAYLKQEALPVETLNEF